MLPEHNSDLLYRLALTFIKDIGPKRAKALLAQFEHITDIFKAPLKKLCTIEGIGEAVARVMRDDIPAALEKAETELKFITKHEIQTLWIEDDNYPARLKQCIDAPVLLFYKGSANLDASKTVAVIGTRKYTDYGQRICEELIEGLKQQEDLIIISGLAHGIDTIAHKHAVKQGIPTIGVMGHGLDRIYPPTNKALSKEMVQNGGLLSEYPSGIDPDRENFPMRNRIVAGISDVTVVVESDISGGALITARIAGSYNRDVAAFPGRVYDTKSSGCNELIRTNSAAMITCADDLLELMGWQTDRKPKSVQKQLFINLSAEEQAIIDVLQSKDMVHADELFHTANLPNSQLAATLLGLEMQGLIKALPGKYYRIN
jgi:DNA processing protein